LTNGCDSTFFLRDTILVQYQPVAVARSFCNGIVMCI